jgi:hypothetical protein
MFNNIKSDKEAKLQINIRKVLKLFLLIFLPSLLLVTGDLPPFFVPPLKLEFVFKQTVGA